MYEISIEVMDAAFPASRWRHAYGDILTRTAVSYGVREWRWHEHSWGVVLELGFADEHAFERFMSNAGVRAALDSVPDPVSGLVIARGWGGTSGSRQPRRPRPHAGAGAAEVPVPRERKRILEDVVSDAVARRFPARSRVRIA